MIGEEYSYNHPIILDFNSSLIEIYFNMKEDADRIKTVHIADKNLKIAK